MCTERVTRHRLTIGQELWFEHIDVFSKANMMLQQSELIKYIWYLYAGGLFTVAVFSSNCQANLKQRV